jgi:uncharacterized protein (TIGR00369 family)
MDEPRQTDWQPRDPDYERAVRDVFAAQRAMALIGARLTVVGPGFVEIRVRCREDLTQQHMILHGGIVGMVVDSACAFAAATLFPVGTTGFSLEYKINFLAPARGDELVARGRVVRPGRTVTVSGADAYSVQDGREQLAATALESVVHFPGQA